MEHNFTRPFNHKISQAWIIEFQQLIHIIQIFDSERQLVIMLITLKIVMGDDRARDISSQP